SRADRLALRQVQSLPVMEQLHGRLLTWKQQLLPKHPMAEAIGYVLNQWKPLTAFLSDGAIPIHSQTITIHQTMVHIQKLPSEGWTRQGLLIGRLPATSIWYD